MDRRTLWLASGLLLAALVLATAWFWPESDEEKIRGRVDELTRVLSFSERPENPIVFGLTLRSKFQELLAPQVQANITDVSIQLPSDPAELSLLAATALGNYSSLQVDVDRLAISFVPEPRAEGTVTLSANEAGALRRDSRSIRLTFLRDGSDFRISGIALGPSEGR